MLVSDDQDDAEDRESVVAAEDRAEDRAGFAARTDRGEDRRRRRRAEDERAADEDREGEVIDELEDIEVQRLHACIMNRRNFRPCGSV